MLVSFVPRITEDIMHPIFYAVVSASLFVLCQSHPETSNITQFKLKCSGKENASTLLDMATDFMNKSRNFCPDCSNENLNCGNRLKSLQFFEIATNLISKAKEIIPDCPDTEVPQRKEKPVDCAEVLQKGNSKSGIYTIWPKSRILLNESVNVYCDMDTDGGGWTLIQRRGNFSTPKDYFFKDWNRYKTGFGNLSEEFWLGNDNIYAISNQANTTIRFDLMDTTGVTGYAHYDTFWIDDDRANYTLHISGYNGTVGDSMEKHNNMMFSTKDRKNDIAEDRSCSEERQGAWWYFHCAYAHLNGLNQPGIDSNRGIFWHKWRQYVGLAGAEMKLRPHRI